MRQYKAVFSNGAIDHIVHIEADSMDDAIDKAEGLYIVLNNGFDLMLVDTEEVVNSLI